jgi:hypothetical protein
VQPVSGFFVGVCEPAPADISPDNFTQGVRVDVLTLAR